jgi:hypothetical protein
MPVVGLKVRVSAVGDTKSGTNKQGKPYSLCRLSLQDSTGRMEATWWEPIPGLTPGTEVEISARNNGKGLAGAKATEYQGNRELEIRGDHLTMPFPAGVNPASPSPMPTGTMAPAPIATPAPAQGHFQGNPGAPTADACLALMKYAHDRLSRYITLANPEVPDETAIGPMISTLVLAYSNGKLRFDPAAVALREPGDDEDYFPDVP